MVKRIIHQEVNQILNEYTIHSTREIADIQSGHINDSFRINTPDGSYFLQKINHHVFYPVDKLMQNYSQILNFLHTKKTFPENVRLIHTKSNASYIYNDQNDSYWRLTTFITNSQSFDKAVDDQMAYDAGKIIASFHNSAVQLDPLKFYTILPNFHNLEVRYRQWLTAIKKDPQNRFAKISNESEEIEALVSLLTPMQSAISEGKIRQFVVHNDTKLNNILFDQNRKSLTLIDWDTVMSGTILYDFGDCLRNIGSNLDEDGIQLDEMVFQQKAYHAFYRGYTENLQFKLSPAENQYLPYACIYMTMLMGIRFLTDYVLGDIYYKISYADQNLARGRNQVLLARKMTDALI